MKKENILKIKKIFIVGGLLIALILVLTGCGNKDNTSKTTENKSENQVENTAKPADNTATKQENSQTSTTKNTDNSKSNTNTSSNNNSSANNNSLTSNNSSTNNTSASSTELVVYREGMADKVPAKEYTSTLGYTIKYATELFSVSYHDDMDWFECAGCTDGVVVGKENVSYSKKIANVSNYNKTSVNGKEAVYTTRRVEGQFETTYYVNSGKDTTYIITTSCQDNTEYLEGRGKIMDAMVQSISIK